MENANFIPPEHNGWESKLVNMYLSKVIAKTDEFIVSNFFVLLDTHTQALSVGYRHTNADETTRRIHARTVADHD